MLSPVGVPIKPEEIESDERQQIPGKKGPPKFVKSIANSAWKNKWSPFGAMRKSGSLIGRKMVKSYMKRRMADLPEEEFNTMLDYMHQIFMRDGSTEYAIFICFTMGMWAINPLESEIRLSNPGFNLPMSFFYGDRDWMDEDAGRRIVSKNKYESSKLSAVYTVNNSDHHMYLDNPEEFAKLIIADIYFTEDRIQLIEKNSDPF